MWDESCCPVCRPEDVADLLQIGAVPIMVGVLGRTRLEALHIARGDIQLSVCKDCSYVGNRIYDPPRICYSPGCDVSQTHSPVFLQYITGLASSLVKRHRLTDKTVLEIGCGQGYIFEDFVPCRSLVDSEGRINMGLGLEGRPLR